MKSKIKILDIIMLAAPFVFYILYFIVELVLYITRNRQDNFEGLDILWPPTLFILHSVGALVISLVIRLVSELIKKPIRYIRSVWIGYMSIFAVIAFIWFINLFF